MNDLKARAVLCAISIVLLKLIDGSFGNVLLMSKDDIHLQHQHVANVIRAVRSKVGRPSAEVLEGSVSGNNEYLTELNRVRRSLDHSKGNSVIFNKESSSNDKDTKHLLDQTSEATRRVKSLEQSVAVDVPVNELQQEPRVFQDRDQIQVVSSAIRVLSKKREDNEQTRQKRNEYQWRRPRTQFVTRTERMSPLAPRYQFPPERNDRYLLDNEVGPYRRTSYPQRRIIYYATLPEIVRRPTYNDWQQPQQLQQLQQYSHPSRQAVALESRPYYNPLVRDNEVTRVQSSVIDVTNNRDTPASSSQTPTIVSSVVASPKYTIIDAEPPYYSNPYNNNNNNNNNYNNNYPYNVRFPQPYYYDNNNRYYDDLRTPPYRLNQNMLPPYYSNKPEYVPLESVTPSPTAPSDPSSTTQRNVSESSDQQISTTSATNFSSDKTDKRNKNSSSNNISVNSRYV